MISQENKYKFKKVLDYYKVNPVVIEDLARSICLADLMFGSNDRKLSVNKLANSGIEEFANLGKAAGEPLPDVQVMRVICDILYFVSAIRGVVTDTHLTNEASNYIGKKIKKRVVGFNTNKCDYSDMEECQRLLDFYASQCKTVSDDEKEAILQFVDYITNKCSNKNPFNGFTLDSRYKEILSGSYFFSNISFKNKSTGFFEDMNEYLISQMTDTADALKLGVLITARGKILGLSNKLPLYISKSQLQTLRNTAFIYNALSSVYTFTHNKAEQSIDSVIILYLLLQAEKDEIPKGGLNNEYN